MSFAERLKQFPVLRTILRRRYDRLFARATGMNLFRGVYADFGAALAAVPGTKPIGYDTPETGSMYKERQTQVVASDYAPMFWLRGLLEPGTRVLDFGGHVGIAYLAYRRYFPFPAGLAWTVCDVPAVVEAGRQVAAAGKAPGLTFVSDFRDVVGADVLIAFGSLQYLGPVQLPTMLAHFKDKPRHLVINKLPVHDDKAFVTLQNMSAAFCPYQVFNRAAFVAGILAHGYELVDSWTTSESLYIPYPPGHNVPRYSGFYFRRLAP